MIDLLSAVLVFTLVFGADYILYIRNKQEYTYVSHGTRALFLGGQITIVYLFWSHFQPFIANIYNEVVFITIFLVLILTFAYLLTREKLLVCHTTSRTERCLTPGYVLTKGPEILFQQLVFAAVAFSLIPILGINFYTYVAYVLILLIMHTPVVLSMNKSATKSLTLGIVVISAPIFLVFTEFMMFWPAVYLHAILYVFLWLTFADWDGKNP